MREESDNREANGFLVVEGLGLEMEMREVHAMEKKPWNSEATLHEAMPRREKCHPGSGSGLPEIDLLWDGKE